MFACVTFCYSLNSSDTTMCVLPCFGICHDKYASEVVIRRYTGKKSSLLVVNTEDLSTRILPEYLCDCREVDRHEFESFIYGTNYGMALKDAARKDSSLVDAGISHASKKINGINLTIDLCPSHKPLERKFFLQLVKTFLPQEKPVPVAAAVSGLWMKEHKADLAWLIDAEKSRNLSITWINHSYSHKYSRKLPLRENFLLEKGTDVDNEIFMNEKAIVENGLVPSVFFRFPGLVSDPAVVDTLLSYGLIPVGSDAWLAKGQNPSGGSIVLVHGNGNEPEGLSRFLEFVNSHKSEIGKGKWLLFDLKKSIVEMEEEKTGE
jgi:hypothetical protein